MSFVDSSPFGGDIARHVKIRNAMIDGEIFCLGADGRSVFNRLLFRRGLPYFYAFNLMRLNIVGISEKCCYWLASYRAFCRMLRERRFFTQATSTALESNFTGLPANTIWRAS